MMATMWRAARQACRLNVSFCRYHELRRTLLSDAYLCKDAWQNRMQYPALNELNFGDFAVQMHRKLIVDGRSSVVDMDFLATKMHEMDDSTVDLVEEIIERYRRTADAFPVRDSIVHGIVRNYIDVNKADRLMKMFTDRVKYGLFPDNYTANILMDHFLKKKEYGEAAQVGYYLMLQEDFSHPLSTLLSLLCCVKHLKSIVQDLDSFNQEEVPDDNEEETWVAVTVIAKPYYDDHFDITNEQFLMGKTLAMIGKTRGDNLLGRSLQIVGLGLHNKFSQAMELLKTWTASGENDVVMEETLSLLQNCLDKALTRNPDEPEKEINIRTKEDEMKKLRITPLEKESFLEELQKLSSELQSSGRLSSEGLEEAVERLVETEAPKCEAADIAQQRQLLKQWKEQRVEMFDEQVKQYMRKQVQQEIEEKLIEMQEKEEVLHFFEKRDKISFAQRLVPWETVKEVRELTEDELEDKLKGRQSAIKKRKR